MKFYNRKEEMEALEQIRLQSEKAGCFTVLVGRRRIGKSALILESLKKQKRLSAPSGHAGTEKIVPASLYLFVSRQTEAMLCVHFQEEAAKALGLRIFGGVSRFRDLFEQLLVFAETNPYTLVIDEFQELERINPAIFSEIQELWDRYKNRAKIHLIACGSIYSMMLKIFEHGKEPLFGRMTSKITLRPFKTGDIKKILKDHNSAYTPEDLLCLYMLSGGIPKYIELLMDWGACTFDYMLDRAVRPDSPFLNEGKELLIGEFGRDYGTYFSILQLIAGGKNTQAEIDSIIGKNTGTYLVNLERDYSLIARVKPMFSKPESRSGRWKISDQYLRFYFRFIYPNQALIETGRNKLLLSLIRKDYEQYSGPVLEDYFRAKIAEETDAAETGAFWDKRGENEIDCIALSAAGKTALVAEVKRKAGKISLSALEAKAAALQKELAGFKVTYRGFSMEDM
jgi:AAA+ ATPase superfamily predicted ATPase